MSFNTYKIQILLTLETDLGPICLHKQMKILNMFFIYRAYALKAEPNDDQMHLIEVIIMKKNK